MAYEVITNATRVSGTLKAELGAMAGRYRGEDAWLGGVKEHLRDILEDPEDYVEYWDLEEAEGVSASRIGACAKALLHEVDTLLALPMDQRGNRGD
jgi:hypothetical protein